MTTITPRKSSSFDVEEAVVVHSLAFVPKQSVHSDTVSEGSWGPTLLYDGDIGIFSPLYESTRSMTGTESRSQDFPQLMRQDLSSNFVVNDSLPC